MSGPRYAVYFAPARDGALWRFGSAVLGYDAATGAELPPLVPAGYTAEQWSALTGEPRRYGFHATLKAPFELSAGRSEGELRAFAHGFAAGTPGVVLAGLQTRALGRFVALTPEGDTAALDALAFAIVQAFEPFRAPLAPADRARRLQNPLTPAERAHLDAYGYPYVGDCFRFHMTLTGALAAAEVPPVRAALAQSHAEAVPAGPVTVDRIALFRQETRQSRFRLLASFSLAPPAR